MLAPAQGALHAQQQLGRRERLADVAVRSQLERQARQLLRFGATEDHRRVILSKPGDVPGERVTRWRCEPRVADHQVVPRASQRPRGLRGAARNVTAEPGIAQGTTCKRPHERIIVNDKHTLGPHRTSRISMAHTWVQAQPNAHSERAGR